MDRHHTPGPWVAESCLNGAVNVRAATGARSPVAEIWHNGHDAKANGALVAAAPDLLAAVRQLNAFAKKAATLDYNEDITVMGIAHYSATIDALIAKA